MRSASVAKNVAACSLPAPTSSGVAASGTGLMAQGRSLFVIGYVALVSLIAFENQAVVTAMPTVAGELHGLNLYAMAFATTTAMSLVSIAISGAWVDRLGPAIPTMLGVAMFIVAMLVITTAGSMPVVVVGRVIQGLGTGVIIVALTSSVALRIPESVRPRMIAVSSSAWVAPSLFGPVIAGIVVEHTSWRWIFGAAAVLAVPISLAVWFAIRDIRPAHDPVEAETERTMSKRGTLWFAVATAASVLVLHLGAQGVKATPVLSLALMAVSLVVVLLLASRLLAPGALRAVRGVPTITLVRAFTTAAYFGAELFLPLLLINEHGFSPSNAGLFIAVGGISWFLGSFAQSMKWAKPYQYRLIWIGTLCIGAGIALMAFLAFPNTPVWLGIVGWFIAAFGMGTTTASQSLTLMSQTPMRMQGVNNAYLQFADALGSAVSLAVGGVLIAWTAPHPTTAIFLGGLLTMSVFALIATAFGPRARQRSTPPTGALPIPPA